MNHISAEAAETTQAIAWTIEGVTCITLVLVVWFVWKISKRDSIRKNAEKID